jgi:hypothetical protein
MIIKEKALEIHKILLKTHLNIFVSNIFLTLKIMNFEIFLYEKLFIFVLFGAWMHYICMIKKYTIKNNYI